MTVSDEDIQSTDSSRQTTPEKITEEDTQSGPIIRSNTSPSRVVSAHRSRRNTDDEGEQDSQAHNKNKRRKLDASAHLEQPTTPKKSKHDEQSTSSALSAVPALPASLSHILTEEARAVMTKLSKEAEDIQKELAQRESELLTNRVETVQTQLDNIVTLQNVKPEWIASSNSILRAINLYLSHASANQSALKLSNENLKNMLGYLSKSDLFKERHNTVMSMLKKIKADCETIKQEVESLKITVNTIQNTPSAYHNPLPSHTSTTMPNQAMSMPVKATMMPNTDRGEIGDRPFCIFCETHTHASEDCRNNSNVIDRIRRAESNRRCMRCTKKFEPNEEGGHSGCINESICCATCVDYGQNFRGANHHPLFCPYALPRAVKHVEKKQKARKGKGKSAQRESSTRYFN